MSRSRTGKRALAAEVWRLMAEFSFANFQRSAQARLMADSLSCDASMVTWLVDQLEERGLVERRTPPNDRRVKTVVLTPLGISTRERLRESFYDPPDELTDLDVPSLESLRNELRKLPASRRRPWGLSPR